MYIFKAQLISIVKLYFNQNIAVYFAVESASRDDWGISSLSLRGGRTDEIICHVATTNQCAMQSQCNRYTLTFWEFQHPTVHAYSWIASLHMSNQCFFTYCRNAAHPLISFLLYFRPRTMWQKYSCFHRCILCVCFRHHGLLWVHHQERGWQV